MESLMVRLIQAYHPVYCCRNTNSTVRFKKLDELTYVLYGNRMVASFDLVKENIVWYDLDEEPVNEGREFYY